MSLAKRIAQALIQSKRKAKRRVNATVTFSASGTEKVATPKTVLDLAFALTEFGSKHNLLPPNVWNDITSDGDGYDTFTGIINVYLRNGLTLEITQRLVEAFNNSPENMDTIQLGRPYVEISGMDDRLEVVRVPVVKNATQNYSQPPEVNLSNTNAFRLLTYLQDHGVPNLDPQELSGEFSIDALNYALSDPDAKHPANYQAEDHPMMRDIKDQFVGESDAFDSEKKKDTGTVNWYDASDFAGRFPDYVQRLRIIADYIEKNHLPKRTISFG